MHALRAALLLAAVGVGCGPPPAPPGTFTQVYAALFPLGTGAQCNYCHDRPANDISNGKLDMGHTQGAAWAALVGVASVSAKCSAQGQLVVPGDPEHSLLYTKFLETPPCGTRMPQGATPLSQTQLDLVHSWIKAGAKND